MATNARRGSRPRALAGLAALMVGWAVWSGWTPAGEARLACDVPVSTGGHAERVWCPDAAGPEPHQPLGVRRALGLPIDPNTLTAEDFASLPGVGPRLAARIVEARRRQGGFRSIDDLGKVKGVGPAKLAMLRAALEPPTR